MPAICLGRGFLCLTLEAASHPPFGAGFYAYPPMEAFQHFEGARDTDGAGGIGVACLFDARSGYERDINEDRVVRKEVGSDGCSGHQSWR